MALAASSSSSSSDTASTSMSRAQLRPINGYERTAEKIFKEVLETRQKAATADWEVPKLFLVERVMSLHGVPHWERGILKLLKLDQSKEDKKARIRRPVSFLCARSSSKLCRNLQVGGTIV